MSNNKRLLVFLFFMLSASTAFGYRIPRPVPLNLPLTEDQVNQLNDAQENVWNLTNGEFNLDEVSTTKSRAGNGDFWILATPITSKIQFRSDDTIYTVCNEGADCGGAGNSLPTPGGSTPQLQYNNSGTFGGVAASGAKSDGNVGLGTSDPTQQLELTKNLEFPYPSSSDTEGNIFWGGTDTRLKLDSSDNIFIGYITNLTSGSGAADNICMGSDVCGDLTGTLGDADDNIIMGDDAGTRLTTGDTNVCLGESACTRVTTGSSNTSVGAFSLLAITSGSELTAFGYQALSDTTTGLRNTGLGYNAGEDATTGNDNVAVGYDALGSDALPMTGSRNIAIGTGSIDEGTSTDDNIAIGSSVLTELTTGDANICVGTNSCDAVTTGNGNILLGYNSDSASATLSNTVGIGTGVVADVQGVFIGADAGNAGSSATDSVFIGYQSGNAITTGDNNTCIGSGSCDHLTIGANNVALGFDVLTAVPATDGTANTCLGHTACEKTLGNRIVAVGYQALQNTTSGDESVAVGYQALQDNTGSESVAVGYQALTDATGNQNTAVGYKTLNAVTTGTNNTAVGSSVGAGISTGSFNTAVGYNTLTTGNGSDNTDIGAHSTASGIGSGSGNTALGRETNLTSSNFTTLLGAYTDDTGLIASAQYSTAIGYNATYYKSNQAFIGGVGGQKQDIFTNGVVNAKGWQGTSDVNSGIDFVTFSNSWTSTATTGNFFDISTLALTTATGLTVKVDNSMTSGRALQVLGGSAGATPIFGVDDSISYFGNVTADPCGGDTTKEGGFFYNKTSSYMCFCNSAGADKQTHSPATDCF